MFFTKSEAPDGWLFCNGATVSTIDYPKLYATIGTSFGGDSSNFKLPDLRNQFLRGISSGLSPATNLRQKYNATKVYATIAMDNGRGQILAGFPSSSGYNGDETSTNNTTSYLQVNYGEGSYGGKYQSIGVRPANMGLLPCIKY